MSASVAVVCDGCYDSFGGTWGFKTLTESREAAKRYGWHQNGSRDLCPQCWREGKR